MYVIFISERYPFTLFRIDFETHEIFIEILGCLRRLQHLLTYTTTRSAPRGINIHEKKTESRYTKNLQLNPVSIYTKFWTVSFANSNNL